MPFVSSPNKGLIISSLNSLLHRENTYSSTKYTIEEEKIEMGLAAQKELEHIGESAGCADHDHDLIHELGKRLDAMWRYDQFIANASNKQGIIAFWKHVKTQDEKNIKTLKSLIAEEVKTGCF